MSGNNFTEDELNAVAEELFERVNETVRATSTGRRGICAANPNCCPPRCRRPGHATEPGWTGRGCQRTVQG